MERCTVKRITGGYKLLGGQKVLFGLNALFFSLDLAGTIQGRLTQVPLRLKPKSLTKILSRIPQSSRTMATNVAQLV